MTDDDLIAALRERLAEKERTIEVLNRTRDELTTHIFSDAKFQAVADDS